MDTKEVLKMEAALKEAKEKTKAELVARAEAVIGELRTIGFNYELTEKNGAAKMGRPKKEKVQGAIDDLAGILTGDPKYYHLGAHGERQEGRPPEG